MNACLVLYSDASGFELQIDPEIDANDTFAKNLADNQGDTPTAFAGEVNYGVPIANRFDTRSDYGNVEGIRRQRFLLTGLYQLPFGQGRSFLKSGGWKNALLGGWEMTTVALLQTGPWLTPSISDSYDQSNTNVVNRGAYLRPDQVSTNFYQGQSRAHYFNLAAFAPTPAGAGRRHPRGTRHSRSSQPRSCQRLQRHRESKSAL